jgi:hypothetical protein
VARLYVRDADQVFTEQERDPNPNPNPKPNPNPNQVFTEQQKNLRAIFEFYSLGDDQEGKSAAGRRMCLQEWETLINDCRLYDSPSFTRNEAPEP